MAQTHKGGCYYGAVEIETTADPIAMGYCHCDGCRKYSGSPIAAFTLWKPEQVKIIKGENLIGKFKSSDLSVRRFCAKSAHMSWSIIQRSDWSIFAPGLPAEVAFQAFI